MNIESSSISLTIKNGKTFVCQINPDAVALTDEHSTTQVPNEVFKQFYHLFSICTGRDKDAIKQLRKDTLREAVAEEVLLHTHGEGWIDFYDLLTSLVGKPAFAEEARANMLPPTSFVLEVEFAFSSPVEIDGYQIALVKGKVKGSDVRKRFEVTATH